MAGYFGDNVWYRCKVESGTGPYGVHFIDFGTRDTLELEHLRPLPEELTSVPALARSCTLAGCMPPPEDSEFAEAAYNAFMKATWELDLLGKVEAVAKNGQLQLSLMTSPAAESINAEKETPARKGAC